MWKPGAAKPSITKASNDVVGGVILPKSIMQLRVRLDLSFPLFSIATTIHLLCILVYARQTKEGKSNGRRTEGKRCSRQMVLSIVMIANINDKISCLCFQQRISRENAAKFEFKIKPSININMKVKCSRYEPDAMKESFQHTRRSYGKFNPKLTKLIADRKQHRTAMLKGAVASDGSKEIVEELLAV